MVYLSISGRPGKMAAPTMGVAGMAHFDIEMRDGCLMHLTFDKATALQWAAALSKAFEGVQDESANGGA